MYLTMVKLHGQSMKRKEIVQTLQDIATRLHDHEECVKAHLYQDINNKDTLYLLEEWQNKDDLNNHEKARSSAVLRGLEPLLVESLEIVHAISVTASTEAVTESTEV